MNLVTVRLGKGVVTKGEDQGLIVQELLAERLLRFLLVLRRPIVHVRLEVAETGPITARKVVILVDFAGKGTVP